VVAIFDDGDVDVDDVAMLEHFLAGDAVAHLMIDGSADGSWVWTVARGRVTKRGRNGTLNVHHVIVAELIELTGADARFHMWRDEVKHL
jgi:hypothetical protein